MARAELLDRARSLGAKRPELMTRVELRDEIVRLTEQDPIVRRRSRGWLGVARDLVASVMDSGLNLPGAAAAIRGGAAPKPEWQGPAPVATVTLAEIYIAQGHAERAHAVLDEVLRSEPDHAAALALRDRLATDRTSRGRIVDVTSTVSVPDVAPPQAHETSQPGETPLASESSLGESGASVAAPTGEPPQSGAIDWGVPEAAPAEASAVDASVGTSRAARPEPVDDTVWPTCALAVTKSALAVRYELERLMDGVTLKVLSFVPRPGGPERLELDVPVDVIETRGGLSLPPPPPGAVVRAVLGVGSNGDFKPLAVAWVYDASGPAMALAFAPPGKEPRTLRANLEAAVRVGVLG